MTRLGRWIDFENDYKTLDPTFMESVWWVFGELWAKDLVYKGFKVSCRAVRQAMGIEQMTGLVWEAYHVKLEGKSRA